ncbi:unnamed protein product [Gordionus sp. m RMFG-2023]
MSSLFDTIAPNVRNIKKALEIVCPLLIKYKTPVPSTSIPLQPLARKEDGEIMRETQGNSTSPATLPPTLSPRLPLESSHDKRGDTLTNAKDYPKTYPTINDQPGFNPKQDVIIDKIVLPPQPLNGHIIDSSSSFLADYFTSGLSSAAPSVSSPYYYHQEGGGGVGVNEHVGRIADNPLFEYCFEPAPRLASNSVLDQNYAYATAIEEDGEIKDSLSHLLNEEIESSSNHFYNF